MSRIFALFRFLFFFFFSLRSVAFHQPRCSAHGAAELAAFVIEVCVVFCSIVCLCAGDCACRFTVALRDADHLFWQLVLQKKRVGVPCVDALSRTTGPRRGKKPKLRNTGPTRKLRNRKILHHNSWDTATSMVVFAKMRRCEQTTPPQFSPLPTPAGRAEMVCPDRYFVKC